MDDRRKISHAVIRASFLGGLFLFTIVLAPLRPLPASAQENPPIQFQNQIPYMVLDPKDPQSVADWQAAMRRSGVRIESGKFIGNDLLASYIKVLYSYGIYIAFLLSVAVLMAGGLIWLSSGGNDGRISKAKTLITGSLIGLILTLGSWTLLNTINPDLLKLKVINPPALKKKVIDPLGLVCEWRCQGPGERCEGNSGNSTIPASTLWYTANLDVCQRNKGNMPTSGCEGGKRYNCCCTIPPKAEDIPEQVSWDACMDENNQSKEEGSACKLGNTPGYCKAIRNQITGQDQTACTPCLKKGDKCNKNLADYECPGANGVCGSGQGGNCDSRSTSTGWLDRIFTNNIAYMFSSTILCNAKNKIAIDPTSLTEVYIECRCQ